MEAWDTTLRVAALVAMLTATGVSTVAWWRSRRAGYQSRALWWLAFLSWTGAGLRLVFAFVDADGLLAVPFWARVVAANLYFVLLGVGFLLAVTAVEDRIYITKVLREEVIPKVDEVVPKDKA